MAQPELTKICRSCGQQKPLIAFLQLADAHGTRYSHICASCRKSHAEKSKLKEGEESSRSSTSITISNKEKVATQLEQDRKRKQITTDYHEEREKQEEKQTKQHLKNTAIAAEEKKHKSFLEKRHVATKKHTKTAAQHPPSAAPLTGERSPHQPLTEKDILLNEQKEVKMDTPVEVMRVTQKIAMVKGLGGMRALSTWLTYDSPIARTLRKHSAEKGNSQKNAAEKNDPLVNKTWGNKPRG